MSNETQVKQEPDVERWKRELSDAGWVAESATAWYAPDGGLYRGPFGAWKELQRRNGVAAVTDDKDRSLAAEFVKRCKGSFPIEMPLEALVDRVASFAATIRKEARREAFRDAIEIARAEAFERRMGYCVVDALERAAKEEGNDG